MLTSKNILIIGLSHSDSNNYALCAVKLFTELLKKYREKLETVTDFDLISDAFWKDVYQFKKNQ